LNGAQVFEPNANTKLLFGFGACSWKIGNFQQLPHAIEIQDLGRAELMQS